MNENEQAAVAVLLAKTPALVPHRGENGPRRIYFAVKGHFQAQLAIGLAKLATENELRPDLKNAWNIRMENGELNIKTLKECQLLKFTWQKKEFPFVGPPDSEFSSYGIFRVGVRLLEPLVPANLAMALFAIGALLVRLSIISLYSFLVASHSFAKNTWKNILCSNQPSVVYFPHSPLPFWRFATHDAGKSYLILAVSSRGANRSIPSIL